MNFVGKVVVNGFWGERRLEFDFHKDVNFIIGINGSGKTTAVNLVVAALTADFSELDRLDFNQIVVTLKGIAGRKQPSVTILKSSGSGGPFRSIEYEIKMSSREKPLTFSLDDYQEQLLLRGYPRTLAERDFLRRQTMSVASALAKMVNVSWLSVHRTSVDRGERRPAEDDRHESTVDRKLKELSNRLVRYFSTLGKQGSQLLEDFQKTVFLSMLYRRSGKSLFSTAKEIDIETEKRALEGIFSQFKVTPKDLQNRLDGHFDSLKKAQEKLHSDAAVSLTAMDISVLIGTERIDYIVDEWHKLVAKRAGIFEPRDTFLDIVNAMMQRKIFSINDQNELQVTTQSGKSLPITQLSSGEKQLLIVLGEALLQEKKPWVYIADEPELSLHVRWQESLVENLRALNPNCQIIFATHSPDVVSTFRKKVFDMENML